MLYTVHLLIVNIPGGTRGDGKIVEYPWPKVFFKTIHTNFIVIIAAR